MNPISSTILLVLVFLASSCATDSTRVKYLKEMHPDCQVTSDAELVCPSPFDDEFSGFDEEDCEDCTGNIDTAEFLKPKAKPKPLPPKKTVKPVKVKKKKDGKSKKSKK